MPLEFAIAKPSKDFFLEMFTRDITLEDCILDLIDNSIDSLIQTKKIDVSESMLLAAKTKIENEDIPLINLTINRKKIYIKDNCGGITLDKARNEAFRFGFKKSSNVGRLSVYGIGLKRAVFKLGTVIKITSRTLTESFNMNFDVSEWAADEDNWTLPLETILVEQSSLEEPGTEIEIRKLRTEVETLIRTGKIVSKLKKIIAETYGLFLEKYVRIILNGFTINPSEIPIGAYSGRFRPGIPTEAGHPFRRKAATYSDVKPATFWGGIGMGGRNQAE